MRALAGRTSLTRSAHGTIRISLTNGSTFEDYGYTGRTIPRLTLSLTPVRVSTRFIRAPAGAF
ncbi:MAG: hypothetical protein M3071_02405 [Actinomycetota bacterium]|nr:hypothetical protein [Actinomycetota bacterium]